MSLSRIKRENVSLTTESAAVVAVRRIISSGRMGYSQPFVVQGNSSWQRPLIFFFVLDYFLSAQSINVQVDAQHGRRVK